MNKALCVVAALGGLVSHHTARAQTPGTWGNWYIGTLVLPGSVEKKWGGYVEVQARSNGLFRQYFYNELKGGLSYDLDKNFTVLLGGGRYGTFAAPGPINVEKRLWQQLVINQFLSRLKLEHRYRIEQRWLTYKAEDSTAFRQRLRYRLNAFLPLNKRTITDHTAFLSVYDEIFLNPKGPVFERNRVYAGLGYQFSAHLNLQLGWLRQANYSQPRLQQGQLTPLSTSAKNNLVLSVMYKLAHRASTPRPESVPSQPD
ncbi:DUF2490 domain-containing protein [Hymenobacter chitinivorans]|uniref:Uncharacterized protein DUF2490 n=1 Tax=Hymenobacter chitinivorans DSM 11115 TaxID=1121954 RepID=A0A2M9BSJ0_9BACT|nr:DUF2490 domain-containing protein [Hymenobacter chitinivorans]PJJ60916.1 uncharacterized protein DUF2490 [Hymenobacter chitinivorans DSM 11115]